MSARTAAALTAAGIYVDASRPRLGNDLDVDLVVSQLMSGGFQVRAALPFAISDDLILHVVLKGAACWSMQSNANAHPVVREVYDALPIRPRLPRFVPSEIP